MAALGLLLSGCAQTPLGPTVQVMPGPGKSFEAFTYDQAGCKQYATDTVAGQAQNANTRAVGAAAIGTVLGAGLGAAIGGGRGAAIGAGSGAVAGTGIGMGSSSGDQVRHPATIRQRVRPVHVFEGRHGARLWPDRHRCGQWRHRRHRPWHGEQRERAVYGIPGRRIPIMPLPSACIRRATWCPAMAR